MIINKKIYDELSQLETIPRNKKIWHQNMEGVRKSGIEYAMNNDELSEYVKCANSYEYFIDKYCKINLYDFQKKVLKNYEENRFNIWMKSRQCGSSHVNALFVLYNLLFKRDFIVLMVSNKNMSNVDIIDKVKKYYKELPFFLKQGVSVWNNLSLIFENGSKIITPKLSDIIELIEPFAVSVIPDLILINEFASLSDVETIYSNIIPLITADSKRKLIISSQPNGYNLFIKLVQGADNNTNMYKIVRTYWWEVPGRDEEWKNEQIKMIGLDSFTQEYELAFIVKNKKI